jgi:hypothetical protein
MREYERSLRFYDWLNGLDSGVRSATERAAFGQKGGA